MVITPMVMTPMEMTPMVLTPIVIGDDDATNGDATNDDAVNAQTTFNRLPWSVAALPMGPSSRKRKRNKNFRKKENATINIKTGNQRKY